MQARRFVRAVQWLVVGVSAMAGSALAEPKLALEDIGFLPAEHFDQGEGLPDLSVVSAAVTKDGQVWLGTMRGLVRYNSSRFVPEPGPRDVFSAPVRDIAATPDDRVWVSVPEHGVYVREAGEWRRVHDNAGLDRDSGVRLRAFPQRQGQGYRLFATGRGSVHEWDGQRWRHHAMPAEMAASEVFDVLLQAGANADEDVLWVATFGTGLWRCRGKEACARVVMDVAGPRFNEISSLEQWTDPSDGSPILWVGSYGGGLARLQHGRWQRLLASPDGLPTNFVQHLQVQLQPGQPPHLWVGTRSGLAHRSGDRWLPVDSEAGFEGAAVKALAIGKTADGVPFLWIGSDRGAARLPLVGPWRTISQIGRKGNGVWSLLHETGQDGGEELWLGSDGEGLLHYSAAGWRHYRTKDGLPSDMVRSLAREPGTGELLVGTWGGELSRFDGRRFQRIPTPWPKSDHEAISQIWKDSDGSLWFCLRESGLARLKDGQWTSWSPKDGHPRRVYDLERVGDVLWASTSTHGIARIDADGRWTYFSVAQGLPDDSFYAISRIAREDQRQVLWIGSLKAGVLRLDVSDAAHPRVVERPALPTPPDPFVYEVVPDGRGNLFLCTNYGAALWRARGNGVYDATDFHRVDGMPHDECNYGALQVDERKRIWIGTIGGVAVFEPIALSGTKAAPLVLEGLTIDARAVSRARLTHPIELAVGTHDLRFEVALRTGEQESGIRYRSQMLGLEAQATPWTPDNQRGFTALPAGDYHLRIEAMDAHGRLAKPIDLAITIPLPFWRTTPALLLFGLLAGVLLYVLLRLREGQQRRREKQLVELVRQRTSELESRGIELRRINEELTRLSYHDPLTDLANRRMLLERLHGEWELAQARGTPLSFLLFDLDQFKLYNDQRGHLAGDDCLREVARRIDGELRKPEDTAGRYGGEEFGVVLPGLTLDQAMQVAERIRRVVEKAEMPHAATPEGVVTISVGVASVIPHQGFSAELLIAAADAALYRAKLAGKNRVEAAGVEKLD
ncbi:diguanylate cyclase domain-containing protein [Arenimonas sp.]|uniref:ligand-binding sensor domain-containing diguanylate cyclase n=1 Tax=Arenimonas sp. TaxID=1872635 RepID=UPI0039E31597